MLRINIPDVAYAEQEVSLGGITYKFIFSFNDFDKKWRFDIYIGEDLIYGGIKVMPEQSLIRFRKTFDDFNHGDLQCLRILNDDKDIGRDNFGIGKAYELIYFSNAELSL